MRIGAPELEAWSSRELVDAATMNRRIRDVHRWLATPPSARVMGAPLSLLANTASALPFYAPGAEPFEGHSYEALVGMAPSQPGGLVHRLVAPATGWYRARVGAGIWAGNPSPGWPGRNVWVDIAVNAEPTGSAIAAGSRHRAALDQATDNIHRGVVLAELQLAAGDAVLVAATIDGSAGAWANSTHHASLPYTAFFELHWGGEL
ncbi:hypothetical protein [Streptomyces ginkgonis]|uniref:hypothetical protein n=1 Tax=Streptomyces ginkgonis TaxID=1812259 RepID=UPI002176AE9F|nr:hypothetical protein [Streptomyces ginkgonis]